MDPAAIEGDDRSFVLKQHADARPVILLAPCISVTVAHGRSRCTSRFAALVGGVPGLWLSAKKLMVFLLLGVLVVIVSVPNGTST